MGFKPPINSPLSYNRFRLVEGKDTLYSPGTLQDPKLGSRVVEIQDSQQPGFAGAVAIQRLEKIWTGTYRYKLWSSADYAEDIEFVKILRAGMKKGNAPTGSLGQGRRARVWRLSDPRLRGLDIATVLVESIGPLEIGGPGKPSYREIVFHEWKKPIQLPLLKVTPIEADTEFEKQAKALDAERASLNQQLEVAKNAKPFSLSDLTGGLFGGAPPAGPPAS